jgi:hypothetical protein
LFSPSMKCFVFIMFDKVSSFSLIALSLGRGASLGIFVNSNLFQLVKMGHFNAS